MKFSGALVAVTDLERSRKFYEEVLGQKVVMDLGWNLCFTGGFSIQLNFAQLMGIDEGTVKYGNHDAELYFEEEDFDAFTEHLKTCEGVEHVHEPKKYEWQQRVIRLYDPDKHIIEIGESMAAIARRYLKEGHSIEETAKHIMHPVEFVQSVAETL